MGPLIHKIKIAAAVSAVQYKARSKKEKNSTVSLCVLFCDSFKTRLCYLMIHFHLV